jgi:hypothetical protein
MENNVFKFYIPSDEQIEDLKGRGVDIELEMAKFVHGVLQDVKDGKEPRCIGLGTTKEQMEEVSKYGINAAEAFAIEFKHELHSMLTNTKKKDN